MEGLLAPPQAAEFEPQSQPQEPDVAAAGASVSSVEQFLHALKTDRELQATISGADPDHIILICARRGIYVDPQLLKQFLSEAESDESEDQELSLDDLADVAGGLGIADVMVTGVVLAVVASNAGGLMSQAQAAMAGPAGPTMSLTSDSSVASQVHTLQSLGINVVVGQGNIEGSSAEWDASTQTMTISADTMKAGAPAVLQAMNHEAVHVAQSCHAGGIGQAGTALGIATSGEAAQATQNHVYNGISSQEQQMEAEAYTLTNQAGAGIAMAVQHCNG